MAGHNKWAQIKRQKGANDAAKSKVWGKLAKRIAVESKKANGDTSAATLRSIIEIAKKTNMPKDIIERAVSKGTSNDAALDAITYETYGPGGAAIVINTLTDNRNRTAQEIKHLLDINGLTLAAQGSALWAFDKNPDGTYTRKTTMPLSPADSEKLMEILEKIDSNDDVEDVFTNAE